MADKKLNSVPVVDDFATVLVFSASGAEGQVSKEKLSSLMMDDEDRLSYGVRWYPATTSSPDLVRTGNPEMHRTLPVQNLMRGCLLADDGTVNQYLPSTSWEGTTRDGSAGQVMVEVGKHYRRHIAHSDGSFETRLSTQPLPGYSEIPTMYVGAYQAALQRSTSKLCSVVNTTTDYRGGNNTSGWDGTYRSLLGRPATNISRSSFTSYARNRGAYGKGNCGWNAYYIDCYVAIYWLFVVEYATLNSQKAYNAARDANGYSQGGLGMGVTEITDWSGYNSYNPFVPCGHTDSLGNLSGVVTYKALDSTGATYYSAPVPRYRGIENPFGQVWHWVDGFNVEISPTTANGGTGLSRMFVANSPANISASGYSGYTHVGNIARSEGYGTRMLWGKTAYPVATSVGGGSSTYLCDYNYTNIPSSGAALRGLQFGGNASYGAGAGLSSAGSSNDPSYASAYIGSRLCFIPA